MDVLGYGHNLWDIMAPASTAPRNIRSGHIETTSEKIEERDRRHERRCPH